MRVMIASEQRGQPEIEQPHAGGHRVRLARDHEQVRRLEIPVHDAGGVQRLEPVRHFRGDEAQSPPVPVGEAAVGREPRDVLHRVEGRAVGSDPQLVHGHHRGMPHPREELELVPQGLRHGAQDPRVESLERAFARGREVEGEMDGAHPPAEGRPVQGLQGTVSKDERLKALTVCGYFD